MNETERAENPVAEAVRGYMRDRSFLLDKREGVNLMWRGADDYKKVLNEDIAAIDRMVYSLTRDVHTDINATTAEKSYPSPINLRSGAMRIGIMITD